MYFSYYYFDMYDFFYNILVYKMSVTQRDVARENQSGGGGVYNSGNSPHESLFIPNNVLDFYFV